MIKTLKLFSIVLGVISAIFAVLKGGAEIYGLYESANATFVLTVDKDAANFPSYMFNWAQHAEEFLGDPNYRKTVVDPKKTETERVFKVIQGGLKAKADDLDQSYDTTYGKPGHYGSVTLTIQNKTNSNYDSAVLNISGLDSFDYWTYWDDFLSMKQRDDFDKQGKDFRLEHGLLVMPLPRISNGGKLQVTVWGREAPFADADLKGVGRVGKFYIVKIQDSPAVFYARHPFVVFVLFLLTAIMAFALAKIIKTA